MLQIPCTGQIPNSQLISNLDPSAVNTETLEILVNSGLQVTSRTLETGNIFSLGDVAQTGGPKMARAGLAQADVVCDNIISMINGKSPKSIYSPIAAEGFIKLTLGKVRSPIFPLTMTYTSWTQLK
jgi:NADH dehydrogenase FAD-containing subunit